ncbi:choline kinase GmCK2p-like protein [Planoprotostelium fungivorum]|uniref:ethanolamine kinase n=1 Tax=Planoprotostelium fungivorum TaxID=1890364 RepID=A0A2P6N107_9EUKA|nr:choline kinase GmCK2p-like protein [Planoprotostelium fungivorum]
MVTRPRKKEKANSFPWRFIFSSIFVIAALMLSKKIFPNQGSEDPSLRAVQLCRTQFDEWSQLDVSDDQFTATKLLGGTTHSIFRCDISKELEDRVKTKTVVLRVFRGADVSDRGEEARLQQFLGDRDLGVQILKDFGEGRIEEFLRGKTPSTPVFAGREQPEFGWAVARTFGRLHRFDETTEEMHGLDINKEPFLSYMDLWMKKAQAFDFQNQTWIRSSEYNRHKARVAKEIDVSNEKWNREVDWLNQFITSLHKDDPMVLSHNDLNGGNVLMEVQPNGDLSVEFIDYEYGGLNFRGFDLGNYFCEHFLDYSDPEWPHFFIVRKLFPQQDYMLKFIRHYLKANSPDATPSEGRVTRLYVKSVSSMLASHLLWSLWDIYQSTSDASGLGFLENAMTRMEEYHVHKSKLLDILKEETNEEEGDRVLRVVGAYDEKQNEIFLKKMTELHTLMTSQSREN